MRKHYNYPDIGNIQPRGFVYNHSFLRCTKLKETVLLGVLLD